MRLAKTKLLVSEIETLRELSSELLGVGHAIADALANIDAMVTMARRLKATENLLSNCGQNCDNLGIKQSAKSSELSQKIAAISQAKASSRGSGRARKAAG